MDLCTLHAQIVRPFFCTVREENFPPASIAAASTAITTAAVAAASAVMAGMMT